MSKTLFDKYGGFGQINRIVMSLYDALLDSDELGPYFDDVDMKRLMDHQTKFISYILGGPVDFSEDYLYRAHKGIDISQVHFDELKMILGTTLEDFDFESADTKYVLDIVEKYRDRITS